MSPRRLSLLVFPAVLAGAVILCNASAASTALISPAVALSNAEPEDRWYLVAPYSEVAQKLPDGTAITQRFTLANAQAVVSQYKSVLTKILDLKFGNPALPIYYGHPDDGAWALANASHDQTVYSRVQDVEARPDGLYAKFDQWDAGFTKLPKGLGISPRWIALPNAQDSTVYEPVKLLSLGLWTTPVIPGTTLVNADGTPVTAPAADPRDAEITTLRSQVTILTGQVTTLTQERDDLRSMQDRMNRENSAQWEKSRAYEAALRVALGQSYVLRNAILPADEAAFVTTLANAGTPEALTAALAPYGTAPGVATLPNASQSKITNLPARAAQAAQGKETSAKEFRAKVDALVVSGIPYDRAWPRAEKEHAALFAAAYGA